MGVPDGETEDPDDDAGTGKAAWFENVGVGALALLPCPPEEDGEC